MTMMTKMTTTMITNKRSYEELSSLKTFEERFLYLLCNGKVGKETFGVERALNQTLYASDMWKKKVRQQIILRDEGNDMGLQGYPIAERIYIHHINPISIDDIVNQRFESLYDPNNLVCVSFDTHQAIHYGTKDYVKIVEPIERRANDTCPWKG